VLLVFIRYDYFFALLVVVVPGMGLAPFWRLVLQCPSFLETLNWMGFRDRAFFSVCCLEFRDALIDLTPSVEIYVRMMHDLKLRVKWGNLEDILRDISCAIPKFVQATVATYCGTLHSWRVIPRVGKEVVAAVQFHQRVKWKCSCKQEVWTDLPLWRPVHRDFCHFSAMPTDPHRERVELLVADNEEVSFLDCLDGLMLYAAFRLDRCSCAVHSEAVRLKRIEYCEDRKMPDDTTGEDYWMDASQELASRVFAQQDFFIGMRHYAFDHGDIDVDASVYKVVTQFYEHERPTTWIESCIWFRYVRGRQFQVQKQYFWRMRVVCHWSDKSMLLAVDPLSFWGDFKERVRKEFHVGSRREISFIRSNGYHIMKDACDLLESIFP